MYLTRIEQMLVGMAREPDRVYKRLEVKAFMSEPNQGFRSYLTRMLKRGLIRRVEIGRYALTEKGLKLVLSLIELEELAEHLREDWKGIMGEWARKRDEGRS